MLPKLFLGLGRPFGCVFFVAIAIGLSAVSHAHEGSDRNATYGKDHRRELFEVTDHIARQAASASLAVFNRRNLQREGDSWRFDPRSLASALNVCPEQKFANQPAAADCSATLISPRRILTAGHCISRRSCAETVFVFSDNYALHSPEHKISMIPNDEVFSCREVIVRANKGSRDFAVIELDRDVTSHQPVRLAASDAVIGDEIFMLGHTSGLPLKYSGEARVKSIKPNFFVAEIDAFGGSSGSGIFHKDSGELVGVLVRGEDDYILDEKRGCNVVHVCHAHECEGEESTKVSIINDELGGR